MLATASETLNHENDCSNQSCKKFGLYEKYMYDHPMTLKFNYSLDEKPQFVIKNENDEPLFKLDKKHHGKIVDMNDNSIFNFRLEVMGTSGVDLKLHTYLENDYLNKKIVTMTRFEKHYFQLIFSNTENEKTKLVALGKNSKNMSIYYYQDLKKVEICSYSCKDGVHTIKIESGIDVLLIFSTIFSIIQIYEANSLFLNKPFK